MELHDVVEIILLMYIVTEAYNNLKEVQASRYNRSMWVSPLFVDRDRNGFFAKSFDRLHAGDTVQFRQAVGMSSKLFDMLFELLEEDLTKSSNRPSISAKCRLFLTLVYLTNGSNHKHLSEKFKMGIATVKHIIKDTCEVLWDKLSVDYLSMPSREKWLQIGIDYENQWKVPHCIGAVAAKCISLSKPNLVVWAVCDANYNFTCIDFGTHDIKNDGAMLWSTKISERFMNGDIKFPESENLENTSIEFPYYVVGDAAFPLKPFLMRPFPGLSLTSDKEMFNLRIFPARGTIENAFGLLKARWKALIGPPTLKIKSVEYLVKATVALHNFVNTNDPTTYCPEWFVDSYEGDQIIKGLWRQEVTPLMKAPRMHSNNASKHAFTLRDQLKNHLLVSEENVYSDFEV